MRQSQSQSMDGTSQSQSQTVGRYWRPAALLGVLFGLVGFYEPAKDIYYQVFDPDYKEVEYVALAKQQQRLQHKNLVCAINMIRRAVQTDFQTTLRYGVCENNDVLVEVYPQTKPAFQQWLSPENLRLDAKSGTSSQLFAPAMAAVAGLAAPGAALGETATPVQMELKTLCQAWQDSARQVKMVRVTDEGGKCFRERINVLSGRIEIREEVACTAKCDGRIGAPIE